MIKIGIELNGVVRNINKQILKYYQKDINPSLDIDEIDDTDDIFKYVNFNSKAEKNEFIYIDYPYEIFACAKPMDKNLPTEINNWMSEMTNIEDEEYVIGYFSLNEEALTIQSTYFFLSKIGTRVRYVIFPKDVNEIWENYDVIITSNNEIIKTKPSDKKVVKIINTENKDDDNASELLYNSLEEVINDNEFFEKIKK